MPDVTEANLWLVRRTGFGTVGEVDAFLRQSAARAPDLFRSLVDLVRTEEEDFVPWAARESVYEWFLLVLTRADAETVALTRYRRSLEDALNTLIGNRVER